MALAMALAMALDGRRLEVFLERPSNPRSARMFWKKKPNEEPPKQSAPAAAAGRPAPVTPEAPPAGQPRPQAARETAPQPGAPITRDMKARVMAGLERRRGGLAAPSSPEAGDALSHAVDSLLDDPALRDVVQDLAEEKSDRAFDALERDALGVLDAAKWRRAGAIMYGVDGPRAKKAYEQAFALDANHFWGGVFLARLRGMTRDLEGANLAASAAVLAAQTQDERGIAFAEAALVAMARENYESAVINGGHAVEASRSAIQAGHRDAVTLREYVSRLALLGDANVARGDYSAAQSLFEEALAGARKLAAVDPGRAALGKGLAELLEKAAATTSSGKDHVRAVERAEEAVSIRRRLFVGGADPNSQTALASALNTLGEVQRLAGQITAAKSTFKEALDTARIVSARNPADLAAKREVWSVLWRLATMGDTGVSWTQVADAMEVLATNGGLSPRDQPFYDEARKRASAN
jgi:tetratricopeptide (TPR) repeat protein